ncbi:MAG: hypothetical protein WBS19_10740 [Candidatus Korobacteraceae bacterium]
MPLGQALQGAGCLRREFFVLIEVNYPNQGFSSLAMPGNAGISDDSIKLCKFAGEDPLLIADDLAHNRNCIGIQSNGSHSNAVELYRLAFWLTAFRFTAFCRLALEIAG